jgi:outer membrane protein, heavy metal efflux system
VRRLLMPLALVGLGLQIGAAQILTLDEVIASVNRSYPPLLAALLEIEVAEANVMAAQGRFDLRIRASMEADQFGFYSNERIFTGVEQPTAMQGTSFFGGWRLGSGSFPPYDGRLDTRSLGEWRGGLLFPLARNRAIDDRRAGLRKAEIGRGIASLSVAQQRLLIIRFAAQRYWNWVAAGRRQAIVEASLKIALDRQEALEESVRLGQLPAIDVIDNQRTVLQRRSLLVEAQQLLQQAAIELSLFYRDPQGNPIICGFRPPADGLSFRLHPLGSGTGGGHHRGAVAQAGDRSPEGRTRA